MKKSFFTVPAILTALVLTGCSTSDSYSSRQSSNTMPMAEADSSLRGGSAQSQIVMDNTGLSSAATVNQADPAWTSQSLEADSSTRGGSINARAGLTPSGGTSVSSQGGPVSTQFGGSSSGRESHLQGTHADRDAKPTVTGRLQQEGEIFENQSNIHQNNATPGFSSPGGSAGATSLSTDANIPSTVGVQGSSGSATRPDLNLSSDAQGRFATGQTGASSSKPNTSASVGAQGASGSATRPELNQASGTNSQGRAAAGQTGGSASSSSTTGITSPQVTPTYDNETLTTRVKAMLTRDNLGVNGPLPAEVRNIQVSTDNGKITLKGMVKNQHDKDIVETRVKEVAGVTSVDNQLQVSANSGASPASESK